MKRPTWHPHLVAQRGRFAGCGTIVARSCRSSPALAGRFLQRLLRTWRGGRDLWSRRLMLDRWQARSRCPQGAVSQSRFVLPKARYTSDKQCRKNGRSSQTHRDLQRRQGAVGGTNPIGTSEQFGCQAFETRFEEPDSDLTPVDEGSGKYCGNKLILNKPNMYP